MGGEDTEPNEEPTEGAAFEGGEKGEGEVEERGGEPDVEEGGLKKREQKAACEEEDPGGGEEVEETAAVEREAAEEQSSVEGVAADLAEVGEEEGAAMVVHEGAGFVEEAASLSMDQVEAQEGIFAGPVVGAEAFGGEDCLFFDEEVATGEVVGFADAAWGVTEAGAAGNDLSLIHGAA